MCASDGQGEEDAGGKEEKTRAEIGCLLRRLLLSSYVLLTHGIAAVVLCEVESNHCGLRSNFQETIQKAMLLPLHTS